MAGGSSEVYWFHTTEVYWADRARDLAIIPSVFLSLPTASKESCVMCRVFIFSVGVEWGQKFRGTDKELLYWVLSFLKHVYVLIQPGGSRRLGESTAVDKWKPLDLQPHSSRRTEDVSVGKASRSSLVNWPLLTRAVFSGSGLNDEVPVEDLGITSFRAPKRRPEAQ